MAASKKIKYTKVNESGDIEVHEKVVKDRRRNSYHIPREYYDLGMYLALPLIGAVFVGRWLDGLFKTKATFTIGLLIFGTISVFYNLYRLYKKDGNNSTRTES